MAYWLRMNQIYAGVIIFLMSIGFAVGWAVNGWRLSGQIEEGMAESVRLQSVIDRQDQAARQLAQEAADAAKAATAARAEAGRLRKKSQVKASAILTSQASSCGEVLRTEWGRL